ncbi:MAG TPA: DegT/DnrJ/EryC1/StrS family aminotransferase, partial [Caldilineaceae bacterium]|nr:DegT/DnrJ/EryC1/StrS family aminotransferase [Caldilineaceae bacterium]
ADHLPSELALPVERPDCRHVYHLYVVRAPDRDGFRQRLQAAGVGSAIHYPVPIHRQPAYAGQPGATVALPETERLVNEIVSLPMHPLLAPAQVEQVAAAARSALGVAA